MLEVDVVLRLVVRVLLVVMVLTSAVVAIYAEDYLDKVGTIGESWTSSSDVARSMLILTSSLICGDFSGILPGYVRALSAVHGSLYRRFRGRIPASLAGGLDLFPGRCTMSRQLV